MKRFILLLAAIALAATLAMGQAPAGFYYTAAIYQNGRPVANRDVAIEITLKDNRGSSLLGPKSYAARTDAAGIVNILVEDEGNALLTMDWSNGVTIHPAVTIDGGTKTPLAPVKLAAVPYALNAVAGMTIKAPESFPTDEPLFAVKDSDGTPIFEVTRNGVFLNVNDSEATRGPRGGFAVNSRSRGNLMALNNGSASFNVDDASGTRGPRGGFAVNLITSENGQTREGEAGAKAPQPLMSLSENESYFSLSSCGGIDNQFTLRDRCNDNTPIFGVTNQGTIVANQTTVKNGAGNIITSKTELKYMGSTAPINRWTPVWHPYISLKDDPNSPNVPSSYTIQLTDEKYKKLVEVTDIKTILNGKPQIVKGLKLRGSLEDALEFAEENPGPSGPLTCAFNVNILYDKTHQQPGAFESNVPVRCDFTPLFNDTKQITHMEIRVNMSNVQEEMRKIEFRSQGVILNAALLSEDYSIDKVEGDLEGMKLRIEPSTQNGENTAVIVFPKEELQKIIPPSPKTKEGKIWLKNNRDEEGFINVEIQFLP